MLEITEALIEKVKAAAGIPLRRLPIPRVLAAEPPRPAAVSGEGRVDIVVLGISTGGPQALRYLVPLLPADFPVPLAIVMHMPVGYTEMYARKLDELAAIHVREAGEGDAMEPGVVLIAPAGRHLSFHRVNGGPVTAHLDARPFNTLHRPSVDVLFQSAAEAYGDRVLGVVMTGMGSDGKQGAAWIKAQGGLIYTESEETCVIYGMPASVVEAGLSDRSLPLDRMVQAIQEMT
jgi:two-component system chemotaxis response regulator CheB